MKNKLYLTGFTRVGFFEILLKGYFWESFETISKHSLGLQFYRFCSHVYLSKCSVLVCKSSLYYMICFLLCSFFVSILLYSSCCDLSQSWISSLPILSQDSVYIGQCNKYNLICWKFDLFLGFFVSSWLIVWADGINGCGWCPEGGREC